MNHRQVSSYADMVNALRELCGLEKPLPDVCGQTDIVENCARCRECQGLCTKHRHLRGSVLA